MGFEIDVDLYLKPLKPFRLTNSSRTLRKGVMSSCLDELLFQAKLKMNLGPQAKVSLKMEDETEVDNEEFFQNLKDIWSGTPVLVVKTESIPSKPTHPGYNEKTDPGQDQLPTYEETQISISPNFNGSVNDKPVPFVEQVTLVRSGHTYAFKIKWSCLADKKTGTKKLFVLDFSSEELARGKLQTGDQILTINEQQINDTNIKVASNQYITFSTGKQVTFEIQHDDKFRPFKEVECYSRYRTPIDAGKLGMVISCCQEMGMIFIHKVDPVGLAEERGLKVGERIFGINGICLMEATMTEVIDALRNSNGMLKFLVQETRPGRKELVPPESSSCVLL